MSPKRLTIFPPAGSEVDTVTLDFEKGVPVKMDGKPLELWDLIMQLNKRAGKV